MRGGRYAAGESFGFYFEVDLPGGMKAVFGAGEGAFRASVLADRPIFEGTEVPAGAPAHVHKIGIERTVPGTDDPRGVLAAGQFMTELGKLFLEIGGRIETVHFKGGGAPPAAVPGELFGGDPVNPRPAPTARNGAERAPAEPVDYIFSGPGKCRSCDAAILWFKTNRGKNFPVDDSPAVSEKLLEEGDRVPGRTCRDNSHFASCPNADEHRKGSR